MRPEIKPPWMPIETFPVGDVRVHDDGSEYVRLSLPYTDEVLIMDNVGCMYLACHKEDALLENFRQDWQVYLGNDVGHADVKNTGREIIAWLPLSVELTETSGKGAFVAAAIVSAEGATAKAPAVVVEKLPRELWLDDMRPSRVVDACKWAVSAAAPYRVFYSDGDWSESDQSLGGNMKCLNYEDCPAKLSESRSTRLHIPFEVTDTWARKARPGNHRETALRTLRNEAHMRIFFRSLLRDSSNLSEPRVWSAVKPACDALSELRNNRRRLSGMPADREHLVEYLNKVIECLEAHGL